MRAATSAEGVAAAAAARTSWDISSVTRDARIAVVVRGAHVRLAATGAENASAVHVVPESATITESSAAEHASYGAADEVVGGSAAPALAFHVVEVTNICRQAHKRVRRNQTQGAGQLEGAKARSECVGAATSY